MAWQFTNVGEPNLDTGPGQVVPGSSMSIESGKCWLLGAHLTNTGSVQRVVTVTDTSGNILCQVTIPAGQETPYEWPFRPTTGIKWFADGAGCLGHLWGYK